MNYLEAAAIVLKQSDRPLTVREIIDQVVKRRLLIPEGKTPEASMSAALYTHVRDVPDSRIRRQFEQAVQRARRDSVKWVWVD